MKTYKNKKVFITGGTGFKGSWLISMLLELDAEVICYDIEKHEHYKLLNLDKHITYIGGDIKDFDYLSQCIRTYRPDIIFHLAAQPLVRDSYRDPVYTFQSNAIGTLNVLESWLFLCFSQNRYLHKLQY